MVDDVPTIDDLPGRSDVISRHRADGGAVAAVFPVHYPRALFRAFGLLPVEVWGPPGISTTGADAHLQAYTCSVVRCGFSHFLSGALDDVDFLLVPHACDSLQGIGSTLIDFHQPAMPVLTLYLPRNTGSPAVEFFAAEIRGLYKKLSVSTGKSPTDDDLREAIEREERADKRLADLLAGRLKIDLSDRDFYRLVRSREYLPAEQFVDFSEPFVPRDDADGRPGVPIVVSGMMPEPMDILDAIGDAGGIVAADDFACTGRRCYPAGRSQDPFKRMAEAILGAPPDSTMGVPVSDRARHLRSLAHATKARGVLFFEVKFCEPEQFYLPQLRKSLDGAGLRSSVIEVDLSDPLPQQAITRLEALLEMIA